MPDGTIQQVILEKEEMVPEKEKRVSQPETENTLKNHRGFIASIIGKFKSNVK